MEKKKHKWENYTLTTIAIIHIIASLAYLALSITVFLNPNILINIPDFTSALLQNTSLITYLGISLIILSIIYLIAGIGILFHKQFARYIALIFSLLMIIGGIASLAQNDLISIISLLFNLTLFCLLLIPKKIRILFHKKKKDDKENDKK